MALWTHLSGLGRQSWAVQQRQVPGSPACSFPSKLAVPQSWFCQETSLHPAVLHTPAALRMLQPLQRGGLGGGWEVTGWEDGGMYSGAGRSGAALPGWLGQERAWVCLQQGLAVRFCLPALKNSLENA